jgi:hypothetical protein
MSRKTLLCVALIICGCGGSPPAASVTPPAGPPGTAPASGQVPIAIEIVPPALPPVDDAIPQAAQADVEIVHGLQRDAGFAALLGADGQAVLDAIDTAQTSFAEDELPALVEQLGLPTGTSGLIASVGQPDVPGSPTGRYADWQPSFVGRPSFTASMMTAMLATGVSNADRSQARSSLSSSETYDSTTGGIRESTSVRTTFTAQSGGGRFLGEVQMETTTTATDVASGAQIGTATGRANGHIDVSACPDAQGNAEGRISISWQEDLSLSGGGGSGGAAAFDAPLKFVDGDDAFLVETHMDLNYSKGAHGPDINWGVNGSMSVTLPAGGSMAVSNSQIGAMNGATTAQAGSAAGAAILQLGLIVGTVAKETERFWRSGKCIELKPSEESREVDPDEQVSFSVEATHKFDGAQVAAPIVASFSGAKSVEPANTPVDAPADFNFTAGSEPGDKGTIDLKQTSRRGIGLKTVEFTVKEAKLAIAMNGTWRPPNNDIHIVVPKTPLKHQDDGTYTGSVGANVSGTAGFPGCSKSFSDSLALQIIVTVDESDSTLARLRVLPADPAGALIRVSMTCNGVTTMFPIPMSLWIASFVTRTGPLEVTIDSPTTVKGSGGSAAASTLVELTREDEQ